jgi:hypothetical protein
MIFATPDFGASAAIASIVGLAWLVIIVCAIGGTAWGVRRLRSGEPKSRKSGTLLVVVSLLIPFLCCFGPSQAIRIIYGNYPLGSYPNNKIQEGMSQDEVVAILGTPHERHGRADGEGWYYWIDSLGILYFGVQFGPDRKVTSTHGN